jgi:hypothetical protein
MHLHCWDPVVSGRAGHKLYEKEKGMFKCSKQCKNRSIQRIAFKGTITLFAVKEY